MHLTTAIVTVVIVAANTLTFSYVRRCELRYFNLQQLEANEVWAFTSVSYIMTDTRYDSNRCCDSLQRLFNIHYTCSSCNYYTQMHHLVLYVAEETKEGGDDQECHGLQL